MSETENEGTVHRAKRPRSPSYPGIALEQAIERAHAVYEHEGKNAAPFEAILQNWGYSARSGAGSVTIAALRKYGLLVYEGKNAKLSDLALTILWNEEDTQDRKEAIRRAALEPSIHNELWQQYEGDLPSDATLRLELRHRGFAESAIPDVINVFRSTIAFAQLSAGDRVPDSDAAGSTKPGSSGPQMSPVLQAPPLAKSAPGAPQPIQLPLVGGTTVTLQASGPVSDAAWEQMMTVLTALKSGFVSPLSALSADPDEE